MFIIKVINYALWHTFESKRYMYFHNKTWYTRTRCYMQSPIWRVSVIMPFSHHWLQRLRGSVDSVSASRFRGRRFESQRRQLLFLFL